MLVCLSVFYPPAAIVLQVLISAMATKTAFIATWGNRRRLRTSEQSAQVKLTTCLVLLLCNTSLLQRTMAASGSFEHCFQQRQIGSIGQCLGQQALGYLQQLKDSPNMTLFDGSLKIERVLDNNLNLGTQSRSIVNFLDLNPTDFR